MKKLRPRLGSLAALFSFLAACASSHQSSEQPASAADAATDNSAPANAGESAQTAAPATESLPPKALEVPLQPKSGSSLSGNATFTETPEGVKVVLTVAGVSPGEHGTHIHENGDCSAPDAMSAGGHFNPQQHPHGLPVTTPRHLGDLGNITVTVDGTGTLEFLAQGANLKEGDANSFLNRALIVHEKTDDGGQPVGNAGGRIGCAEIK